jgi:hypothetical protein
MTDLGIWDITYGEPQRFQRGAVALEEHLENWIEQDPSLVQPGLVIVGRQVVTKSGRLDLLGLDPVGTWAIIEIKRGDVTRDTVAQAIDYASVISELADDELAGIVDTYLRKSKRTDLQAFLQEHAFDEDIFSERKVAIVVVGTGRDQNLERIARFLGSPDKPVQVVNFDVFENDLGQRLIIKQLTEIENNTSTQSTNSSPKRSNNSSAEIDRLMALASGNGIGGVYRLLYDELTKLGLYPRTYKWSIMYAPPTNKTRVLIYANVKPRKGFTVVSSAFAEFFPVSEREVYDFIGRGGDIPYDLQNVKTFIKALRALFEYIESSNKNRGTDRSKGWRLFG